MERLLYITIDSKAEDLQGGVLAFKSEQQAIRFFCDCMRDKQSILHTHPEDFDLYFVGTIDNRGTLIAVEPRLVISGVTALAAITNKEGT